MLLNTSFNLAGFPIVENFETLEFTAKTSEFKKYLCTYNQSLLIVLFYLKILI